MKPAQLRLQPASAAGLVGHCPAEFNVTDSVPDRVRPRRWGIMQCLHAPSFATDVKPRVPTVEVSAPVKEPPGGENYPQAYRVALCDDRARSTHPPHRLETATSIFLGRTAEP